MRYTLVLICLLTGSLISQASAQSPAKSEIREELRSKSGDVKFLACLKLGHNRLDPQWAIRMLLDEYAHEDAWTKTPCEAAFVHWGSQGAQALLEELKSGDPKHQHWAAKALWFSAASASDADAAEISQLLISRLNADDLVESNALIMLGARAIPAIETAVRGADNEQLQNYLVGCLARMRPVATDILLRLAKSDDPVLQALVADKVRWVPTHSQKEFLPATATFVKLLESDNRLQSEAGFESLKAIGVDAAPIVLQYFSVTKTPRTKRRIIELMEWLTSPSRRPDRRVPHAVKVSHLEMLLVAAKDDNESVRIASINPLLDQAQVTYVPVFRDLLQDKSDVVRLQTIKSIHKPPLFAAELEAAKTDKNPDVRAAAEQALSLEVSHMGCGYMDGPDLKLDAEQRLQQQMLAAGYWVTKEGSAVDSHETSWATSLAVLSCLGTGKDGPVRVSLPYLLASVAYQGNETSPTALTARGATTFALCEVSHVIGGKPNDAAARLALRRLIARQDPITGGWGKPVDWRSSIWAALAIRSALSGPLANEVPASTLQKMEKFFAQSTDETTLPAEVMLIKALGRRLVAGASVGDLSSPALLWEAETIRQFQKNPGSETCFFGRLLFQLQDPEKVAKNELLLLLWQSEASTRLGKAQFQLGEFAGSWPTFVDWQGHKVSSVETTALGCLTYMARYQHLYLFKQRPVKRTFPIGCF